MATVSQNDHPIHAISSSIGHHVI